MGAGSPVWIDTDAAVRTALLWVGWGDHLHREGIRLEERLAGLGLTGDGSASRLLATAAAELWTAATVVRRAADAVVGGDASFDPGSAVDVARLLTTAAALATGPTDVVSSVFGDRGGTGTRELRTPYAVTGATPVERGRQLAARALADAADASRLRPDEFGLVRFDDDHYLVVLPGVVDLSAFSLGWDRHHRSVRDLDRAAIGSAGSTNVAHNPYARSVWRAMAQAEVPRGAEVLIVGHSFGADTALDLAADPGFNGPAGYRVTHVVAAGYFSGPQLPAVVPGTEVLVLQNRADLPVIAEAVGDAGVLDAAGAAIAVIGAVATLDPAGAVRHGARSLGHQLRVAGAAIGHVAGRADDAADLAAGLVAGDVGRARDGAVGLLTLEPGVRSPAPGRVVAVFHGGVAGAGHAPALYSEYLRAADDPAVTSFLAGMGAVVAGAAVGSGAMVAVDVSVPD